MVSCAYIWVLLRSGEFGGAFRHEYVEVLYGVELADQLFTAQVWRKWQLSLFWCWQGLPDLTPGLHLEHTHTPSAVLNCMLLASVWRILNVISMLQGGLSMCACLDEQQQRLSMYILIHPELVK